MAVESEQEKQSRLPRLWREGVAERLKLHYCGKRGDMAELARRAGLELKDLSAWANGDGLPNAENLAKLAKAGVDVDHMLTGRGRMLGDRLHDAICASMKAKGFTDEMIGLWVYSGETMLEEITRHWEQTLTDKRRWKDAGFPIETTTTTNTVLVGDLGKIRVK